MSPNIDKVKDALKALGEIYYRDFGNPDSTSIDWIEDEIISVVADLEIQLEQSDITRQDEEFV